MKPEVIRILLVEDNPGDIRLVRETLVEANSGEMAFVFDLAHAEYLKQALALLAQERFDLILLDLSLPDSQGLETICHIVNNAPTLPVVVMTGLDDQVLALQAVQAGAQDYLIKGQVDKHLFTRTIHYSIERKRTEAALARRVAQLKLINDIGGKIAAVLELDKLLKQAAQLENNRQRRQRRAKVYLFDQ
jgi:CheY-like chemotaxis protein